MQGRFHRTIEMCHQQYGPVFRVSPNELSFASVKAWKGIYGPWPGGEPFLKTDFYDIYGAGFNSPDLASTRDVAQHNRMKRSLAGGFSAKALLEQETIVQECIDLFISKIGVNGSNPKGINMTEWYEMIAFDVLGEMAFGNSFHCIKNEEPHFWQQMTVKHLFFITVVDNLRRYPLVRRLGQAILPSLTVSVRDKHTGYSREQVARYKLIYFKPSVANLTSRMANTSSRKDILTHVISKVQTGEISQEELTAHSSTLVLAGGETVGTFMSAVTFYLCKYSGTLRKLQKEVRDRYQNYEQIDATSAMHLPYLQAVINEGLRIFPPASQGFPRYSPGAMVDGYYIPKGTELYTSAWSVTHDSANFHHPNDFIPERWIDPNCTDVKEASQPFSLGPRGCIGRKYVIFPSVHRILGRLIV
ncbi:hypothetical protein MMC17_007069 [Xylographa soralifera]|nr:hypothetical protein [Xylographa soralifera]